MSVVFSIAVSLLCLIQVTLASQAEHKLIDHLFSHYDKRVRPAKEANEPVQLSIENIHIKRLTHVNEAEGTVDIGFWVGFSWNDSLLSWEPSSYKGIKHISVRANTIWTPDITLFSGWGVAEATLRESQEHDVLIMSSGVVFYYPSVKLTLPCLNYTGAGELECNFALGSWVLGSDMMHLNIKHKTLDTEKYVVDPKYDVGKTSAEHMTINVPAWDETWEFMVARIELKKH